MGRKKLVEILDKEIRKKVKDVEGTYLVVYDNYRGKYSKEFYQRILELQSMGYKIMRIQKSVYLCEGLQAAIILSELAEHHDAEVRIFKVEKEIFKEEWK